MEYIESDFCHVILVVVGVIGDQVLYIIFHLLDGVLHQFGTDFLFFEPLCNTDRDDNNKSGQVEHQPAPSLSIFFLFVHRYTFLL